MLAESKAIAVITARGGSKGLPRKNVLPLAGQPLIVHSIRAALDSNCFARVAVTTEDPEIADVSARAGAEVVNRPAALATDDASSLDVLRHALEAIRGPEVFALLQPTSPLRTAAHVRQAFEMFQQTQAQSCVSVTPMQHPPQKCLVKANGRYIPLFDKSHLTMPRQKLTPTVRINGALYIGYVEGFLKTADLFAEPMVCYELPDVDSVDIDTADDLIFAEFAYARRHPKD